MKKWVIGMLGLTLFCGVCAAEDKPALMNEDDRISYSVGYQVGGDFKQQGVKLNPEILLRGIQDVLTEKEPLMTRGEMSATLVDLKKKIIAAEEKQHKDRIDTYREEGRQFLAENAKKNGVVTLPSGLQYEVLQEGTGKKPTLADTVTVNYRGTLINGTEFDSSYKDGKPATITLSNVIPGWKEALPMMKEGAKWKIFLPPDLAFGVKGVLEDRTVIYEIELISVKPAT